MGIDELVGELYIGYTDDALLMIAGRIQVEVIRKIEEKLETAGSWTSGMKLTFSVTKTNIMCLKRRLEPPYFVRMVRKRLVDVIEMDYLGVTLDNRRSFKSQLKRVAGKLAPMFQRIRPIVAST